MTRYHARWILPISGPPIRDGWIATDRGRVVAVGTQRPAADRQEVDLGDVVVMPGLVNAHTHLELSYLRDEVPPSSEFVNWIRNVMAARRQRQDPNGAEIMDAVDRALAESEACGTAIVGDISNTLVTFDPLTRSRLAAVVFFELIRFSVADARAFVADASSRLDALPQTDWVRTSLAVHAPYSVAPLIFRAVREAADADAVTPCSVHLSESTEETEFIRTGEGPWRVLLEELGVWDPRWVPPGGSPVQFLDEAGFLGPNVLAVHGVQMTPEDLERLKARGATLVTCPRSNGHTGAGAPPIDDFYQSGVRVAIGTDSLASAPDLSIFAELATIRALAPSVAARDLLESATRHGAHALGFESDFGTIEPGKRSRLIAVSVPGDVDDVEEYLVGGIQPSQIRWIDES